MKKLLNLKGVEVLNKKRLLAIDGGGPTLKKCSGSCAGKPQGARCYYNGHCNCPGECTYYGECVPY